MHPCSFSNGGHYKPHIVIDIDIDIDVRLVKEIV